VCEADAAFYRLALIMVRPPLPRLGRGFGVAGRKSARREHAAERAVRT